MTWRVTLDRKAEKDLRAIRDPGLLRRIGAALDDLEHDPRPQGAKKLAGHDGLWRVRVSDWRIVYAIEDDRLVVLVVAIGGRGSVYERLGR